MHDESSFILLYKSVVRPCLEYVNSVWCPYKQDDVKDLEKNSKKSYQTVYKLKSSAVAEMVDRGHNRHGPKRGEGCCAPFPGGSWVPV